MKKIILWLSIILLWSSCTVNIGVNYSDQDVPKLDHIYLEDFELEQFTPSDDTVNLNYYTAAKLAINSWDIIFNINDVINIYNDLVDKKIKFFAGQTWFWTADSAVLFATYEDESNVFCELFVNHNTPNERKLLWGTYNTNTENANFHIPIKKDTFILYSDYTPESHSISLFAPSYPFYIITKNNMCYFSYEITIDTTTAKIILYPDESGKIKYYKVFADSLWHCWNSAHKDTDCDQIE